MYYLKLKSDKRESLLNAIRSFKKEKLEFTKWADYASQRQG